MSDIEKIRDAMRAASNPDETRKADILARAAQNFETTQGSTDPVRPMQDRPKNGAGILQGVTAMLKRLNNPAALTATTALVAVGLVAVLPVLRDGAPDLVSGPVLQDAVRSERARTGEAPTNNLGRVLSDSSEQAAPNPRLFAEPFSVQPEAQQQDDRAPEAEMAPSPDRMLSLPEAPAPAPELDTEAFANADPSDVKIAAEEPVSTFSIDVDTASYAIVRQSLMAGRLPPPEAVRVEEMVNYFPYAYAPPEDAPFAISTALVETPWNAGTRLLRIGLQGAVVTERPPLNLVFLVDTSGSMQDPAKLPLLKQSFRLMLSELRPEDEVAIVAYAGSAGVVLEPTQAREREAILDALERLEAGGSTAGQQGLELAYATATGMGDGIRRVILATDGDFNVGLSDPTQLEDFIATQREGGAYLSVLGFGRGNLDDATMQALAQAGNGQAAYIDTLSEARKVLVDQLGGALFPIADDVKIQVEFNPAEVAEYRLIGYETRALRREDFNNDAVDAGEIGAGHAVTALYEVTPVGSVAVLNDPLRFGSTAPGQVGGPMALLRLRAKAPGSDTSTLQEVEIAGDVVDTDIETAFAAAIAGWGQVLRGSNYLGDWSISDAATLAQASLGADPFGYRREAVTLMRLSDSLSR